MGIELVDGIVGWLEPFPIHFDVPSHHLPLNVFIETASAAAAIVTSTSDEVFAGQITLRILVLPPETGSFKKKLGIFVGAVGIVAWNFIESDIGKAFIEGLTDHKPEYWAKGVGEAVATYANEDSSQILHYGKIMNLVQSKSIVDCAKSAKIISQVTKGILSKPSLKITQVGLQHDRFEATIEARNRFYRACISDNQVAAVGFEEEPEFPIKRSRFEAYIVSKPESDESSDWKVDIADIRVTSPNWDRSDKQRLWKAKTTEGRERFFKIDDEQFWKLVEGGKIRPLVLDSIRVQWAFRFRDGKQKDFRVLKILMYNGRRLSKPLSDKNIKLILGVMSQYAETIGQQTDLFAEQLDKL